jgi:hypothetical protein
MFENTLYIGCPFCSGHEVEVTVLWDYEGKVTGYKDFYNDSDIPPCPSSMAAQSNNLYDDELMEFLKVLDYELGEYLSDLADRQV